MIKQSALALLLALSAIATPLQAKIAAYEFDTPQQEERFYRLSEEIRCLVCQNQNIADSNAELAQDLRREIYGMIKAGMTDDQITTFLVDRYGDFVLYRPPVKGTTLVLWIGPFLMFIGAIVALVMLARGRARVAASSDLSTEERARLDALIEDNEKDSKS